MHLFGHALIRRPGLSSTFRAVRGAPVLKMLRLQRQIFAIWLFAQLAFYIKILVFVSISCLFNIKRDENIIMRLDKFLKVSRVIKRRTVSNEACNSGKVKLNGRAAKPSAEVRVGDIIEIGSGNKYIKFEVVSIDESASKSESSKMIKILSQVHKDNEDKNCIL